MKIEKPIFVIGSGRSGSSIFHEVLTMHPQVTWLSGFNDVFPEKAATYRFLMGAVDLPGLSGPLRKWNGLFPGEAYGFWDHYCKGFGTPCRDLRADDVTNRTRKSIPQALEKLLTKKRSRLLVKITGWPRVGFLREIFPDAKFIHVIRDGRAVANSLLSVPFWRGWQGPAGWRWGPLSEAHQREWEAHNRSFVALACIQWKILMDATEEATAGLSPDSFLTVSYEDFCAGHMDVMQEVVRFCDLKHSRSFERFLNKFRPRNANIKWQQELTAAQQETAQAVLGDYLRRYKYLC